MASTADSENGRTYQIPDNGIRTILELDKDFYIVQVTGSDSLACSYSQTVEVSGGADPVDFEIVASDSIVSCIGDEGSITIGNVTGDTDTTFTVQLLNDMDIVLESWELRYFEFDGGFTIDASNTDALIAGKYYVKLIQNQDSCANVEAVSQLITIHEPMAQLGFEILDDEVSISDRPTGMILGEVIPSGGNPYFCTNTADRTIV